MSAIAVNGKSPKAFLDELRAKHEVVGCTLGILANGQIQTVASGSLNLDTGVDCTPDTVFQIGSIGKTFTATLIMQLADEGRLSLDDTVIKHLPDFTLGDASAARTITIGQLLNHTSGMDGDFFPSDDPEGPSTASYIRKMCLLPSLFPPGEGPATYCNSGFVAAGRIIEVLTGMTWQNAVMERICKPLGMPAAFAHPHEALRFRCAMGHVNDPADMKKLLVASATFLPMSSGAAGAVLSMSAESLLLFAKAHMADGEYGEGKNLLSAQSARLMRQSTIKVLPFTHPGMTDWGVGWFLHDGGYKMVGHDGGTLGQYTYLRMYPEKGVAFTLLTNSPSIHLALEIEKALMQSLMGLTFPPDPLPADATPNNERYIGEYANVASHYSVGLKDGKLTLGYGVKGLSTSELNAVLEPHSEDVFTIKSQHPIFDGTKLLFLENEDGRARYIRIGARMGRRQPTGH